MSSKFKGLMMNHNNFCDQLIFYVTIIDFFNALLYEQLSAKKILISFNLQAYIYLDCPLSLLRLKT